MGVSRDGRASRRRSRVSLSRDVGWVIGAMGAAVTPVATLSDRTSTAASSASYF